MPRLGLRISSGSFWKLDVFVGPGSPLKLLYILVILQRYHDNKGKEMYEMEDVDAGCVEPLFSLIKHAVLVC